MVAVVMAESPPLAFSANREKPVAARLLVPLRAKDVVPDEYPELIDDVLPEIDNVLHKLPADKERVLGSPAPAVGLVTVYVSSPPLLLTTNLFMSEYEIVAELTVTLALSIPIACETVGAVSTMLNVLLAVPPAASDKLGRLP